MADSRLRARRGTRPGTSSRQTAKATVSDSRKNAGRTTLLKQRPTVLPDLDNDTPRVMLKRIIRTQPQVSPLAPRISRHEETEEARSELPSRRVSSMGEMQLPDLVPENASIAAFHMTKKRKKLSISEFERAADKRLPQNQAQSALDSTALARSLRISLGALIPPDTVEKRGLLRRPKYRKAIDMEAFEGGVEQNMLKRKAQDYLVDSQTASGIQTALLASDAEIMLSNTELFVQPQLDEQNQNKLSALEPQLSDSKTSAQRSKISAAAPEEARLAGLVSSVGTNKGRTQRYSEDLILDHERIDRMSPVSPKPPANQQEEKQGHSQQSNPMEQLSVSEEMVVGNREIAKDVEAGSLGRRSHAFSSEKSGLKPLEEAVEQADDQADELKDQAITIELDGPEEEPTEDEAEDPESEEVSMKTPAFVRAAAYKPPLSAPHVAKPAAPKLSTPRPAKSAVPRSLLQAKPVPKSLGASGRKTREPAVASSLIKKIFSHYVKMPVARDAFRIVEKCSERYFKQLSNDLEAYTNHAGRKTVEMADLEVLMRRQGLVTDKMPLRVLIERYLPLEYRKVLIPVAVSGNKVIPCK
ncbi:centromere protein T isoform X3 [Numenius arquata]|uniref:centromere protein T isoform X3 n=1 Tax=Numenius arquata TaxID=31919 RepID=UPI003D307E7E